MQQGEVAQLKQQIIQLQQDIKSKDRVIQSQRSSKIQSLSHLQVLRKKNTQLQQKSKKYEQLLTNNNKIIEQLKTQISKLQRQQSINKKFIQGYKSNNQEGDRHKSIQVLELESKIQYLQRQLKTQKQGTKIKQKQSKNKIDQLLREISQLQNDKAKLAEKCKACDQKITNLLNKSSHFSQLPDSIDQSSQSSFEFPSTISAINQKRQSIHTMKKKNDLIVLDALPAQSGQINHIESNSKNSSDQSKVAMLQMHLNELKKQNLSLHKVCRQLQNEIQMIESKKNQNYNEKEDQQAILNKLKKQRLLQFINDEEMDHQIQPKRINKKIFESMRSHFNSIQDKQKMPYLNMISIWSEQMLDRIKTSLNDLTVE